MKFEINVTLETETEGKFDDVLTQVGMLLFENKANIVEWDLKFKKIEGKEMER